MPDRPLEPTGAQLRGLLADACDYVVRTLAALPDAPASDHDGVAELLADPELRRPPGERGRPLPQLLELLDRAAAKGFNPSSPGYLAFVPGSGLVSGAV